MSCWCDQIWSATGSSRAGSKASERATSRPESRSSATGFRLKGAVGAGHRLPTVAVVLVVLTISSPMIFLNEPWANARFDGKGRAGLPTLDDHRATWQPILDRITETISK